MTGGSKDTNVTVGLMKPGGSDGLDVIVVAGTPGASAVVVGMDGVVAGKKLGGISEAISTRKIRRSEQGTQSERASTGGDIDRPLLAIEYLAEDKVFHNSNVGVASYILLQYNTYVHIILLLRWRYRAHGISLLEAIDWIRRSEWWKT